MIMTIIIITTLTESKKLHTLGTKNLTKLKKEIKKFGYRVPF